MVILASVLEVWRKDWEKKKFAEVTENPKNKQINKNILFSLMPDFILLFFSFHSSNHQNTIIWKYIVLLQLNLDIECSI